MDLCWSESTAILPFLFLDSEVLSGGSGCFPKARTEREFLQLTECGVFGGGGGFFVFCFFLNLNALKSQNDFLCRYQLNGRAFLPPQAVLVGSFTQWRSRVALSCWPTVTLTL